MTIVEFLEARLAEDEQIALNARHDDAVEPGVWMTEHHNSEYNLEPNRCHVAEDRKGHYWTVASEVFIPNAEHIACHDPARVLREVEAKRGVIREMESARTSLEERFINVPFFITWTLWHIAAIYSDHPDYRKEWAIT